MKMTETLFCLALIGLVSWLLLHSELGNHSDPEVFRGITIQTDEVRVDMSGENEALVMMFMAQEARKALEKVAKPRK